MYCSNCGSAVNTNLNYCNICGAKLPKSEEKSVAKSMLDGLLTTLFLIIFFGLGILVGLVAVLLDKGVDHKPVFIIIVFYLAIIGAISYMLLSQFPKLINANLSDRNKREEEINIPPLQMPARNTAQLEEAKTPASVTEHTTKTLDEVFVKKN